MASEYKAPMKEHNTQPQGKSGSKVPMKSIQGAHAGNPTKGGKIAGKNG